MSTSDTHIPAPRDIPREAPVFPGPAPATSFADLVVSRLTSHRDLARALEALRACGHVPEQLIDLLKQAGQRLDRRQSELLLQLADVGELVTEVEQRCSGDEPVAGLFGASRIVTAALDTALAAAHRDEALRAYVRLLRGVVPTGSR